MMASNDDAKNGVFDKRLSRYDLVLAVIPTAFLLAVLASELLGLAPRTLLGAAGLVGALAVADTLFLNPPTSGSRPR